jgi:uncharacterized protein (DUF2062 family)
MQDGVSDIEMSMEWFKSNIADIFIPLYVGSFFYAFLFSIGGYYLVNWLWVISVNGEKKKKNYDRRER